MSRMPRQTTSRSMSRTFLHFDARVQNSATWASKTSETTDPGLQDEPNSPTQFPRRQTTNSEYLYNPDISSAPRHIVHSSMQGHLRALDEQLEHDWSDFELQKIAGTINLRQTLIQLSTFLRIVAETPEVTEIDQSLVDFPNEEFRDSSKTCTFHKADLR